MKYFKFIRLFIFFLLFGSKSYCQTELDSSSMFPIDFAVKLKTDSLLLSGIDTVFGFYKSGGWFPDPNDSIANHSRGAVFDNFYILYIKKQELNIIRFVDFYSETDAHTVVLQSEILKIKSDRSFPILRNKLQKIEEEQFLPFITEFEENGIKGYELGGETDAERFKITISAKNFNRQNNFEEYILGESYPHWPFKPRPININYRFNKSKNLYYVFYRLKDLTVSLNEKFIFY